MSKFWSTNAKHFFFLGAGRIFKHDFFCEGLMTSVTGSISATSRVTRIFLKFS